MSRGVRVEDIDTHYLVICSRCKILPITRESDRVYCTGVMADGGKLLWLSVVWVKRFVDSFRRPYPHVSVWMYRQKIILEMT